MPMSAPAQATHLNYRHALLDAESGQKFNVAPLLGYEGARLDLGIREKLSKAIDRLRHVCLRYHKFLLAREDKNGSLQVAHKIKLVTDLLEILKNKPLDPEGQIEMLHHAGHFIQANKNFIQNATDSKAREWMMNVVNVVASVVTVGVYSGIRAIYSRETRGTVQFWRKRDDLFVDRSTAILNKIETKLLK